MEDRDIAVWRRARQWYSWRVRLADFSEAARYPGFFDRVIEPGDVAGLEDHFRATVGCRGAYAMASEVCFWKNYGISPG